MDLYVKKEIILEKLAMFLHAFSRKEKEKIIHAYFCLDRSDFSRRDAIA